MPSFQSSLWYFDFFVLLFLLFNNADGHSGNDKVNSAASNRIKRNDFHPFSKNDDFAKFKNTFSDVFANGEDLDHLDHNEMIAYYNNVVHSSNKKASTANKSSAIHSSTSTSSLINYFSNDVMDYSGEHKTITNHQEDFEDDPIASSTFKAGLSTESPKELVFPTLSQPSPDNFSNESFNYAFNWSSEHRPENETYKEDEAVNQLLMEQLIHYNRTRYVKKHQTYQMYKFNIEGIRCIDPVLYVFYAFL